MRLFPVLGFITLITAASDAENYAPYEFGIEKTNFRTQWWMVLAKNFMNSNQLVSMKQKNNFW